MALNKRWIIDGLLSFAGSCIVFFGTEGYFRPENKFVQVYTGPHHVGLTPTTVSNIQDIMSLSDSSLNLSQSGQNIYLY